MAVKLEVWYDIDMQTRLNAIGVAVASWREIMVHSFLTSCFSSHPILLMAFCTQWASPAGLACHTMSLGVLGSPQRRQKCGGWILIAVQKDSFGQNQQRSSRVNEPEGQRLGVATNARITLLGIQSSRVTTDKTSTSFQVYETPRLTASMLTLISLKISLTMINR